jgi:hypothetical protein
VAGSRRQPNDDAIRSSEVPQKASEIAALPNPYGRGEAQLNGERLHRNNAWQMVRRRAQARQMAAHASTRTTQLYDRREDRVTLDEVVKINIRG